MTLDLLIDSIGIVVLGLFLGVLALVFATVIACAITEAVEIARRKWKR